MFRLLKANEIECRFAQVKQNGASVLLYKTARTDMDMLDEQFTPFGWECEYKEIKNNMYCGITVHHEGQPITKWDCGKESFADKEKGEASDAFKRAGFKWGIGRELYTAPFIWITSERLTITQDKKCFDKLTVSEIGYNDNREINNLVIVNQRGETVYSMGKKLPKPKAQPKPQEQPKQELSREKKKLVFDKLVEYAGNTNAAQVVMQDISGKRTTADLTEADFEKIMKEVTARLANE